MQRMSSCFKLLPSCPSQVVPWQARPNYCRGASAPGPDRWQLPHKGERPPTWFLRPVLPQHDQRGQPLQVSWGMETQGRSESAENSVNYNLNSSSAMNVAAVFCLFWFSAFFCHVFQAAATESERLKVTPVTQIGINNSHFVDQ